MGPAIAQGVEIALSGHDRADAAGDVPALTPGVGPEGGRRRGNIPTEGVVSGVNWQISAIPHAAGGASGARILICGRQRSFFRCRETGGSGDFRPMPRKTRHLRKAGLPNPPCNPPYLKPLSTVA